MGVLAGSVLLASAGSFVGRLIVTFCYVYILLILLYVVSTMLPLPYSIWLSRVQRFLYDVCEPYLRLFRRILPAVGPLDLSPFVASLVLVVVASLVSNYA
jgi:YggT family protein